MNFYHNNNQNIKKTLKIMRYHIQIIFNIIDKIYSKESKNNNVCLENFSDTMIEIRTNEEYITQIIDKNLKKVFVYYSYDDKKENDNLYEFILCNIQEVADICIKSDYLMSSPLRTLSEWKIKFIIKSKI